MPQVNVTIAGKAYRMACGEGEEPHLEGLAQFYDGKIEEMRQAFGEIGDMRLHVMAALMVADEVSELRQRDRAAGGGTRRDPGRCRSRRPAPDRGRGQGGRRRWLPPPSGSRAWRAA